MNALIAVAFFIAGMVCEAQLTLIIIAVLLKDIFRKDD